MPPKDSVSINLKTYPIEMNVSKQNCLITLILRQKF